MIPRPAAANPPRVLGVLAGQDMPAELLKKWAASADVVFAADAGLDRLLAAGASPDFAVGDFDSAEGLAAIDETKVLPDLSQDATDCDKLLALASKQGYASITLASAEGDQLDHMLATLHSAVRAPIHVRVALRRGIGWLLKSGEEAIVRTATGRRVSFLPLEEVVGAQLAGVEWPLENASLHPQGATSISNRATAPYVAASVGQGSAFLFVEFPEEELPNW
jgi:thiamine pyrophosphokinase